LQFVTTILHEPKLIILDEPFSGLDPVNANLIKDEIFNLAKKGSTIIFSTHRMEQVEEICDQIVLVNLGKKILDGTVTDIKQQFKENIFSIQTAEAISLEENEIFSVVSTSNHTTLVKIQHGYKSNDVLAYLLKEKIEVVGYNEVLPSLNEIFIQLVEDTHSTTRAFQPL
ncbi:MAG: ABC transporter ATP-binding protein, partial [Chitinophagaceae bacterium]